MSSHTIKHVRPEDEVDVATRFADAPGAQLIFGKEVTVILTPPQMTALVDKLQAHIDAHMAANPVADKVVHLRRPVSAGPTGPDAA